MALAELDKTYKGPELDLALKKSTQKADKVISRFVNVLKLNNTDKYFKLFYVPLV